MPLLDRIATTKAAAPKELSPIVNAKQASPESTTPKSSEPQGMGTPAYYEVWGGLESANRALWVALWLSATASLLLFLLLRLNIQRPPVVITINGAGQAQVLTDTGHEPPVTEAEIRNFLAIFEKFFTELDVYTYDSNLRLAFSMMTQDFQAKANDMLKRSGTIEELKVNQGRTKLFLGELSIVKETRDILECHVKGYRQISSFKPDGDSNEVVFEDAIILKKVPRTEQSPYGVLVEDFRESVFKK